MVQESYFYSGNECYYMAHSKLASKRPTLLIIHGLGDSGMSYREFLHADSLKNYNILIPDLLGHGKSSGAEDYSFQHQVHGILKHIDYLAHQANVVFSDFILLSHSMGGIHATLLCKSPLGSMIKKFINIEGSITQYGAFISARVAEEKKKNTFFTWFEDFKQSIIYQEGNKSLALRYYYASLIFCHAEAFLQNAMEMHDMSVTLSGKYSHIIGEEYAGLNIPRIYCYGNSMCAETLEFLKENKLQTKHFNFPTHFFMPDGFHDIVDYLTS